MRQAKLSDIASVQVGYTFRTGLSNWAPGDVAIIQMKDISDVGLLSLVGASRIQMDDLNENHVVRLGDIVFKSRGAVNASALVGETDGPTILSAPLYRIRVNQDQVDPAYLNWLLRQSVTRAYFKNVGEGSAMVMVSKQDLLDLPLCVPPMEVQKQVVEVANLLEKEKTLCSSILEKRNQLISARLAQIVSEA